MTTRVGSDRDLPIAAAPGLPGKAGASWLSLERDLLALFGGAVDAVDDLGHLQRLLARHKDRGVFTNRLDEGADLRLLSADVWQEDGGRIDQRAVLLEVHLHRAVLAAAPGAEKLGVEQAVLFHVRHEAGFQ